MRRRRRFFPRFRRWLDDGPSRSGRFAHGFFGVTGRPRISMAGSGAASSRRRSYPPQLDNLILLLSLRILKSVSSVLVSILPLGPLVTQYTYAPSSRTSPGRARWRPRRASSTSPTSTSFPPYSRECVCTYAGLLTCVVLSCCSAVCCSYMFDLGCLRIRVTCRRYRSTRPCDRTHTRTTRTHPSLTTEHHTTHHTPHTAYTSIRLHHLPHVPPHATTPASK